MQLVYYCSRMALSQTSREMPFVVRRVLDMVNDISALFGMVGFIGVADSYWD